MKISLFIEDIILPREKCKGYTDTHTHTQTPTNSNEQVLQHCNIQDQHIKINDIYTHSL